MGERVIFMGRVVALEWGAFMAGELTPKQQSNQRLAVARKAAATIHLLLFPRSAFAAAAGGGDTWAELFSTVLNISDWLCVGIIVFSGVTWMFGNRTKALEFLMGGAAGFIIIQHAVDIRNWLKTL